MDVYDSKNVIETSIKLINLEDNNEYNKLC